MIWKLAAEWRPSKQQYYWKRPESWDESWRPEETCCLSDSSEKPLANTDVKNSKGVNNNNDNDINRNQVIQQETHNEIKLFSRKLIKGINTWAVPRVRYSRLFLKWTREELEQTDQRTKEKNNN